MRDKGIQAVYVDLRDRAAVEKELAGGAKFVLVTFTANHAEEKGIIPAVTRTVAAGMAKLYPGTAA